MSQATTNVRAVEMPCDDPPASGPKTPPAKILVAVHGIGNQFQYATIQAVAHGFCRYLRKPATIPLGRFHRDATGPYMLQDDPLLGQEGVGGIGFAEIYWADIPREVVEKKYVLEEAQGWARALVSRIRLRHAKAGAASTIKLSDDDFHMLETVIDEMIRSVDLLERLFFLAKTAGLFTFELKALLSDFLGDVQIVTEFASERRKLLDQFRLGMEHIHADNPDAEIYIVAHSEGTVVALLGLLEGLVASPNPPWVRQVRGLMTIGSPLNKHIVCWPELWEKYQPAQGNGKPVTTAQSEASVRPSIVWHNYSDRADPIGFKLGITRKWLTDHGWNRAFDFPEENDHQFARYPLPGKAHNDYWQDDQVFGHFIQTVVKPGCPERSEFRRAPGSKFWPGILSASSYLVPFGLLFTGVYFFYKGVHSAVGRSDPLTGGEIAKDVFLITCLLGSITVLARIPRLCKKLMLHAGAFALFLGAMVLYGAFITPHLRNAFGGALLENADRAVQGIPALAGRFAPHAQLRSYDLKDGPPPTAEGVQRVTRSLGTQHAPDDEAEAEAPRRIQVWDYEPVAWWLPIDRPTLVVLVLATILCLANHLICRFYPAAGMWGLIGLGCAASFLLVASYVWSEKESPNAGPLWPVFLSGLAFFYLWWLGAMVFDLVFAWRRYIRNAMALTRLEQIIPIESRP